MSVNPQKTDQLTTIQDVKDAVQDFIDARDWQPFHDPKNVAMAMASEVGELLDLFRWVRSDEAFDVLRDPDDRLAVQDELADITMFLVDFANICDIDIAQAVQRKMQINNDRYPVEKAKGTAKKYTEFEVDAQD
ncbi:nucleotide pyrophosphohydrolase [Rubripirellula sp.]|jgi:NTP pyrophosphatase (non-canonical NTP hydrolase)|nr:MULTISPECIES: nucleotide pyrophosphohydrolase [Pirellulaceae]MDB4339010.1 nucleotide pyrophosphohydrolase [Rubripirellula sp.]